MRWTETLLELIFTATLVSCYTQVSYFADNGFSNLFRSKYSTPTGEYFNGVTYIAYQGPHEDAYVAAYNHTSESWKGPFKVLVNLLGLYPEAENKKDTDNHGTPTLVISNDGYINVIISGHGGCQNDFQFSNEYGIGCQPARPNGEVGRTTHARSVYPENIEAWYKEEYSGLSPFSTYVSSFKMDNGDIFIIYRHGTHRADWVYQKSTDGGIFFQPAVPFLKYSLVSTSKSGVVHYATWYASCFAGSQGKKGKANIIGCQFTHHYHQNGPGISDGPIRIDGYYVEINTITEKLKNSFGHELDSPLTLNEANEKAMIFNSSEWNEVSNKFEKWNYDLGGGIFNSHGEPCLLFHRSAPGYASTKHMEIYYWRYNKEKEEWNLPTLLFTFHDSSGSPALFLDDEDEDMDPLIMTLQIKSKRVASVRYLEGKEGGTYWEWMTDPTMDLTRVAPSVGHPWQMRNIRNAHKDARGVVATHYTKLYSRTYLFGDNGIVPRQNETEASNLWVRCYNALLPEECYNDKRVMLPPNSYPSAHPSSNLFLTPSQAPFSYSSKVPSIDPIPSIPPSLTPSRSPVGFITSAPTINCVNDHNFRYNGSNKKTCIWISYNSKRRKKMCNKAKVYSACPLTCGLCCTDDETFNVKEGKGCAWLRKKRKKQRKIYCSQQNIRIGCAETCDFCLKVR